LRIPIRAASMSAQAAQRDVISRHGARKKVFIPGYRGCIQHMQETQFGTFGDSAQAAYRMAEGRGKGPGRESAVYCTADALYHPDPDARYKTNKGNQSHIMFGDDRDWCSTLLRSQMTERGIPGIWHQYRMSNSSDCDKSL